MAKVMVDGKSKTQAADEVYDCGSRESARVVGSVTWKSIESVLEQEYDKYGLSKELILTALVEDIKSNPGKRERLLDMGGKFLGMGVERKTIEHTGKGIEALFSEIDDTKRLTD